MAVEVIMPQMGFDMKEGTLVRWIKQIGEEVVKGEPLAEIETDKAVVEIEAFDSGVLRQTLIEEGTTVPVGHVIGVIGGADEAIAEMKVAPSAPAAVELAPAPKATAASTGQRLKTSPLARKEAQSRGIDIAQVPGTGPNGRITRKDVVQFAEEGAPAPIATPSQALPSPAPSPVAAPAAPPPAMPTLGTLVPLSRMRQAIARNMSRSKQENPHIYITAPIDMTAAVALRKQLNEALADEARISINDMVLRAAAMGVAKYTILNSTFTDQGVQVHPQINIGMAIALDDGLVAPGIIDCDRKGLADIAREAKGLAERARAGKLGAQEYTGATFNVTNLGMYGVEEFTAIITPPQSSALAVGAVMRQPVVKEGAVAVAEMMRVTLSVDHRVTDGALGAQFLAEVRSTLENPLRLLI